MVNSRQTRQSIARFSRGALLFVFAAATILPFCTAFFLCAMPCCHGGSTPSAAVKAPMPACPGSATEGCATEITSVERNTATAAAPTPTAVKLAIVRVALVNPPVPAPALATEAPPAPAPAPLHILNSVFRI